MTVAMRRFALLSAVLGAGLFAGGSDAQTQSASSPQNGIWQTSSANPSRSSSLSDALTTTAAASRKNSGVSSWSAGSGSFGAQNTMPKAIAGVGNRMGTTAA